MLGLLGQNLSSVEGSPFLLAGRAKVFNAEKLLPT